MLDFIKIKNFTCERTQYEAKKKKGRAWEKRFANHISSKRLNDIQNM